MPHDGELTYQSPQLLGIGDIVLFYSDQQNQEFHCHVSNLIITIVRPNALYRIGYHVIVNGTQNGNAIEPVQPYRQWVKITRYTYLIGTIVVRCFS